MPSMYVCMNKDANNKTTKNTFAPTRKQNETKQQQRQQNTRKSLQIFPALHT